MEKTTLKPYVAVIVLLLATLAGLAVSVDVRVTGKAGVHLSLPDQLGDWTGREILFCQNPTCQEEAAVSREYRPEACPQCGGKLDMMTLAERNLLPLDTVILKKRYFRERGGVVYCTIVLSGKDRASIHRPEVCLVGQGRKITDRFIMTVPMEHRKPLDVMVLDLLHTPNVPGNTPPPEIGSYYAYWFSGVNRETPHHWQRMVWMGMDRVFRNVAHQWAYISVGGGRNKADTAYRDEIQDFVQLLYPAITVN